MTLQFLMSCRLSGVTEVDFDNRGPRACEVVGKRDGGRYNDFWLVAVDPPIPSPSGSMMSTVLVSAGGDFIRDTIDGLELDMRGAPYRHVLINDPSDPMAFVVEAEIAPTKEGLPMSWREIPPEHPSGDPG